MDFIKIDDFVFDKYITTNNNNNNNDLNKMTKDTLIFIAPSWHCTELVIKIAKNKEFNNIVILANSESDKEFYEKKLDNDILFVNNNAFLNENNYSIYDYKNNIIKKYDLIINSCYRSFKNVNIAELCKNTIHIGYNVVNSPDEIIMPRFGYMANFTNKNQRIYDVEKYKFVDKKELVNYMHESYVGGIFSQVEGACLASSEYLLCGMPVITPYCNGGREIWYNNENHVKCVLNKKDVYSKVMMTKDMIINNKFNPNKIRNDHIKKSNEHRSRLIDYINEYYKDKLIDDKFEPIVFDDVKDKLYVKALP